MPSKRFLSTAAPLVIVALAGMGLATAQSSSPFATNKRTQAWEQPAQPQAQPQSQAWQNPTQVARPQTFPPQAFPPQTGPSQGQPVQLTPPQSFPQSYSAPPRAPAAAPVYRKSSTATPPKTYGGQPAAAPPAYAQSYSQPNAAPPPSLAGGSTPPQSAPGAGYAYSAPQTRLAQAPNLGTPAPRGAVFPPQSGQQYWTPPSLPAKSGGSPFAPRSPQRAQAWESAPVQSAQAPQNQAPQYQYNGGQAAPTYQGYQYQGSSTPPTGRPPQGIPPQGIPPQGIPPQGNPNGAPFPGGPFSPQPQQKRSWKDRLGLGNIQTLLRGAFTAGAAASFRETPDDQFSPDDGTSEDFIGDAEVELEVNAITRNGLEYGFVVAGRAQYDPFRRGFGGRVPDCPPTIAGCSGNAAASATGLRGHSSGFYAFGEDIAEDFQGNIESAHLFLRSAYGDVTIGRDDGAAYLFSLGAPSLLAVGASNSPVDYTGLDSVKTINEASGFSEKVTYTSPRLLGDQIGVGIQFGASYALDADVCGVDYCNGRNIDDVTQAEIEDVFELGLALDRTFDNGLGVELTGTYAHGSEASGLAGLDDLDSFGAGLEFTYNDWTLGGSYLQSNNGLIDGDYTAYDVGATWQPSALGFTLGYGHAEDDNIGLTSDQATFGVTYDFKKFTFGTGVQLVDREVNGLDELGALTTIDQRAASVFVQGGFKF